VDKLTLAALSATLALFLEQERLADIPLYAMLSASLEGLRARAEAMRATVSKRNATLRLTTCNCESTTGGGTLPLARIASAGIAISGDEISPDSLAAGLRRNEPPVIGRLEGIALIIDLRTVAPAEDPAIVQALSGLSGAS
jgi:L-seryl-tRNA(Ser) seleniumtransferase